MNKININIFPKINVSVFAKVYLSADNEKYDAGIIITIVSG